MEWVVTTGRSVEEAKDAALDELGVDERDAEFEVLEEPRQGLFGRQRGEARVRARVRPTAPRPKADRRDRRRRESNARSTRDAAAEGGPAEADADAVALDDADDVDAGDGGGDGGDGDGGAERAPAGPRRNRRRRRGGRSGGGARSADDDLGDEDETDDGGPAAIPVNGGTSVAEAELSLAEQGDLGRQFVAGLLEAFGVAAEIKVDTIDDETLEITVDGGDLGLLIGPKGQTLQAVQELTRTAVQRRSVNRTGRILVDIGGYRVRRREALERFTKQVASDVIATGTQRMLEPMSAADRKIVHDTANDIDGVRTLSEGEEPYRRVVIVPADAARGESAAGESATTGNGSDAG